MSLFAALAFASLVSSVSHAAGIPGPAVHVGDPALLFSLPAVNEDAALRAVAKPHVALSDMTGVGAGLPARAVVVQFIQRSGAEAQLQALNRLHKKYVNRGIRFLAIVPDDGELAVLSEWVESQRLEFPVLRDAHHIVVDRYGIKQFPLTMVVDGRGEAGNGDILALGAPKDDLEVSLDAILAPIAEQGR